MPITPVRTVHLDDGYGNRACDGGDLEPDATTADTAPVQLCIGCKIRADQYQPQAGRR